MSDYKSTFFIKEGPRKVDFDMDRVFLHSSVSGSSVGLHSDEIKELLDEKLLKLDDSLKKRHGELVNYLREVDDRISRVEEGIRHSLDSSQELDKPNLRTSENIPSFNQPNGKLDNEFGEFSLRKENSLPNIAIDQEELDALLEGLNDISKDGKETLYDNDLDDGLNKDGFVEELSDMELNASDNKTFYNEPLEEGNNSNTVPLKGTEDSESLGTNFDFEKEENLIDETSSFRLASVAESDFNSSMDIDSKVVSSDSVGFGGDSANKITHGDAVEKQEECDLENLAYYLNESFNEEEFSDESLNLLNKEEQEGREQELANFDEVSAGEIDNDINDYDLFLNKEDETVYDQKQEIDDASSNFKELDDFEDVLKTDLNCSDLQNCVEDFEEENLYNNQVENLEERLEHSEELNLHSKTKTEDSLGGDDLSSFSFTEVERVINKFDDNEYLSKIELSNEERSVLIKFIDKLEGDLAFSTKGSSFKSRREYEILQKIKRLLVRE